MYQCQFQGFGFPRDHSSEMSLGHGRNSASPERKDDLAAVSCGNRWWRIREQRNQLDEFWDPQGYERHELNPCEDERGNVCFS